MSSAEIVTAAATAVSAGALCWTLYYQYADRRKPRVFLYRFKVGAYWFLQVKCVGDPIENCTAFFNSKSLIVKGTDLAPTYARPLTSNESCFFTLPEETIVSVNWEGTIIVKDSSKKLQERKFKDIPVHDPNKPVEITTY